MTLLKEQQTYFLSGYVYANEWNKYGAITCLSIMDEDKQEYRIFYDEVSNELKEYNWEFMRIEYVLVEKLRFGPWIKIISFESRDQSSKKDRNDYLYDAKERVDNYVFEKDFEKFVEHKNYDENEWNYREAYYAINREI